MLPVRRAVAVHRVGMRGIALLWAEQLMVGFASGT